ncbi:hypothetical protein F5B20DRAFT_15616 [Whalleya microplaca]|nr:hypothetical protein F5B20DRAFT_15616 [Whalleya microplaca]
MAKSSRASSRKANNQRLKSKVFSPVETARTERLSARLLELAAQPKPEKTEDGSEMTVEEVKMDEDGATTTKNDDTMDIDGAKPTTTPSRRSEKKRIEKRRKKSNIVFPRYKDKKTMKRKH